jgi:CspA family cold shock protein
MLPISHTIRAGRGVLAITIEVPLDAVLAVAPDGLIWPLEDVMTSQIVYDVERYVAILRTQKESGVVKWFDDKKGFGFLHTRSGDLFVHWKGIAGEGYRSLSQGQRVRFFRRPSVHDERGETFEAFDVEIDVTDVTPESESVPIPVAATAP